MNDIVYNMSVWCYVSTLTFLLVKYIFYQKNDLMLQRFKL